MQMHGLNWHTDLTAAIAKARHFKRPILSLRLLGRLDEELSCANSRFFKKLLYPHRQINEVLREQFVLHWQSVRPVPIVTIDFSARSRRFADLRSLADTPCPGPSGDRTIDHEIERSITRDA